MASPAERLDILEPKVDQLELEMAQLIWWLWVLNDYALTLKHQDKRAVVVELDALTRPADPR